jgi:hypothetical protein
MDGRCATCKHWEYADKYTPEWESLPPTHLWAFGECALLSDDNLDYREVECGRCEHLRASIDTHWTFGCVFYERKES